MGNQPIHRCPPRDSSVMPCCGRTPFELPHEHRLADDDALVTCRGARDTPSVSPGGVMTLWALHITGSDDLIAMPDRETAVRAKGQLDFDDAMDGLMGDVLSPPLCAEVVEWPYSPEAHAKQLREAASDGH